MSSSTLSDDGIREPSDQDGSNCRCLGQPTAHDDDLVDSLELLAADRDAPLTEFGSNLFARSVDQCRTDLRAGTRGQEFGPLVDSERVVQLRVRWVPRTDRQDRLRDGVKSLKSLR